MAVRTKALWQFVSPGAAGVDKTVYTVPSGETTILKTLVLSNNNLTTGAYIRLGINSATGAGRFLDINLAAGEIRIVEMWLVINAGQSVVARTDQNVRTSGSGTELEGVAD